MDEILSSYGLEKKALDRRCSDGHRRNFALTFSEWRVVGDLLHFADEDLDAIDRSNSTEAQKKTALLDFWTERDGEEATYLKLAEALIAGQHRDLVESLCKLSLIHI